MKLTLLTYANREFAANRDRLAHSAKLAGFSRVVALGPDDIAHTDFWRRNQAVLTLSRGAGYWLWKPYIIRETLLDCAPEEVLVYSDAGPDAYYRFSALPTHLSTLVRSSRTGFLLGAATPQHGPLRIWTKRDCLVLCEGDCTAVHEQPLIQATWSVWTRNASALEFLDSWLSACEDPRCLTDMPNQCGLPNHDGFVDHRHDQSVASVLAATRHLRGLNIASLPRAWGYDRLQRLFPASEATHRFEKRIDNIEAVLRGVPASILFVRELVRLKILSVWRRIGRRVATP